MDKGKNHGPFDTEWLERGYRVFSLDSVPVGRCGYERIVSLCAEVKTDFIAVGDRGEEHALGVGKLKVDVPCSRHLSRASEEIERLLLTEEMQDFYHRILGRPRWRLQRLQINVIRAGGYIGEHFDLDTDPRRQIAMVIHLPCDYAGGEFVIFPPSGGERRLRPDAHSVVFSRGDLRHAVAHVEAGERRTIVAFLCTETGEAPWRHAPGVSA